MMPTAALLVGCRSLRREILMVPMLPPVPFGVCGPSRDAKYEAAGMSSANMQQLDIIASSMTEIGTAPCSASAPCYKVAMQLNNLSLAGAATPDTDTDLVWSTQWFVPSTSDTH